MRTSNCVLYIFLCIHFWFSFAPKKRRTAPSPLLQLESRSLFIMRGKWVAVRKSADITNERSRSGSERLWADSHLYEGKEVSLTTEESACANYGRCTAGQHYASLQCHHKASVTSLTRTVVSTASKISEQQIGMQKKQTPNHSLMFLYLSWWLGLDSSQRCRVPRRSTATPHTPQDSWCGIAGLCLEWCPGRAHCPLAAALQSHTKN